MIKKFDEKFEKVEAAKLLAGVDGWETVEREYIFKKADKLYIAYPAYFSREQSPQYISMVPYEEDKAMGEEAEIAAQKIKCIIEKFPYIILEYKNHAINQTVTGDAYINLDTGEMVEDTVPQFFEKIIYTENIEEGFSELIEAITKHKIKAGSEFQVVFTIYPFADPYSLVVGDDELLISYICLTKLAIVKNLIITTKKEDSK